MNKTQKELVALCVFTLSVWFSLSALIILYCYSGDIGELMHDFDKAVVSLLSKVI